MSAELVSRTRIGARGVTLSIIHKQQNRHFMSIVVLSLILN
jgi:hypothetical protein